MFSLTFDELTPDYSHDLLLPFRGVDRDLVTEFPEKYQKGKKIVWYEVSNMCAPHRHKHICTSTDTNMNVWSSMLVYLAFLLPRM